MGTLAATADVEVTVEEDTVRFTTVTLSSDSVVSTLTKEERLSLRWKEWRSPWKA